MKPEDIEPNSFEVMAQQFQDNKDAFDSKLSNLTKNNHFFRMFLVVNFL